LSRHPLKKLWTFLVIIGYVGVAIVAVESNQFILERYNKRCGSECNTKC
jgi:hypothetical protein